jgi:hypothetical protein
MLVDVDVDKYVILLTVERCCKRSTETQMKIYDILWHFLWVGCEEFWVVNTLIDRSYRLFCQKRFGLMKCMSLVFIVWAVMSYHIPLKT